MSISEPKRAMLSRIASSPRKLLDFCENRGLINPVNEQTAQIRLDQLVEHGYLSLCEGVYSITTKGRQALDAGREVVPSKLITNASSRERYEGRELRPFEGRPGAMDFMKHTSGAFDHPEKDKAK